MSDTWAALNRLAECLCESVDAAVLAGDLHAALCRCGISPGGEVAYDFIGNADCGESDGQGFVVMLGAYNSTRFPQPDQGFDPCGINSMAIVVNVGIIRSIPISEDGEPMTADEMLAASLIQVTEMELIKTALTCCYVEKSRLAGSSSLVSLGTYTSAGPVGGAVGGYWSATISIGENDD